MGRAGYNHTHSQCFKGTFDQTHGDRRGDGPENGVGEGYADTRKQQRPKAGGKGRGYMRYGEQADGCQQKLAQRIAGSGNHQRQAHEHYDVGINGNQHACLRFRHAEI